MPAALPGSTDTQNRANPSAGACVIFDPLSGPKAAPLDAKSFNYATGTPAGWDATTKLPILVNDPNNISTGGLCTGIGFGSPPIFDDTAVNGFSEADFTDNYVPGQSLPSASQAADASIMYIGGGLSNALGVPTPRAIATVGLCMAGQGGSRDGGTTPFTGFPIKTVTATASVANGAAVETGFVNRSGVTIASGRSVFGSSTTPLTDVT
jgi:hypothetical protein